MLHESRTKSSHERAKFANFIALIQVNVRISRFIAAMSRQMGSDWSQLLEVSSTLFVLRWRSQGSCATEGNYR